MSRSEEDIFKTFLMRDDCAEFLSDSDRIHLSCNQCGKCCKGDRSVFLTPLDIFRLVKGTGKKPTEFLDTNGEVFVDKRFYLPQVRLVFRSNPDGKKKCIFLDDKNENHICRVQNCKPDVCRILPLERHCLIPTVQNGLKDVTPKYSLRPEMIKKCVGTDAETGWSLTDLIGGEWYRSLSEEFYIKYSWFLMEFKHYFRIRNFERLSGYDRDMYLNAITDLIYLRYDFDSDEEDFLVYFHDNWAKTTDLTVVLMDGKIERFIEMLESLN